MAQVPYDLCRRCTRPVPPGCDFCATCGDLVLVDVQASSPPVMLVRRPASQRSVRQRRKLPHWCYIPVAVAVVGMLLSVIRILSAEPAHAGQFASSSQVVVAAQQEPGEVTAKSTAKRLIHRVIRKEAFVNAYVKANFHDPDLGGYTPAEIAELADVEFRMRFRTCGPAMVCDSELLSMDNSRGMRAMRLIEATDDSATANERLPQDVR